MSRGTSAVDDYLCSLVGQERGRVFNSVGRQVNRSGQVRVLVCDLGQCLNELKLFPTLDFVVKFVSGNCLNHIVHSPLWLQVQSNSIR